MESLLAYFSASGTQISAQIVQDGQLTEAMEKQLHTIATDWQSSWGQAMLKGED